MSSDPSSMWLNVILILVLVGINGFFVAAETALGAISRRYDEDNHHEFTEVKKLDKILKLTEDSKGFTSGIRVITSFLAFLMCTYVAIDLANSVESYFHEMGLPYSHILMVLALSIALSYIYLVLGEVYPKKVAMQHQEAAANNVAGVIIFFNKVTRPFVFVVNLTVKILLKITGQKTDVSDDVFSEQEIISMLEVGQETGVLKEEGKKMINSIFAFDDKLAYEIMTPRTEVFYIDINDPKEEYMDELMELKYSRVPVYEDDSDNIIGILHIKDFLIKARKDGFENVDMRPILRKPYFVPETKNIDSLFFELQSTKQHIAILIDEYGGFSGIVTMEDIIEQVMGNIDDEYDEEELPIEKLGEDCYRIDGFINLDQLNEELGLDLESENSETLGGFLIDILGEIPDEDEKVKRVINFENCEFTIDSVKERRIETVILKIIKPEETDEDADTESENSIAS